jgi:hypothetical protein
MRFHVACLCYGMNQLINKMVLVGSKGKVHPRTGHEGPDGSSYCFTLSLTSAIDWMNGKRHAPADLLPGRRPDTHFIGGWLALGPVWTGAEYLAPTGIRSPYRPARSGPTERSQVVPFRNRNGHITLFNQNIVCA